MASVCVRAATAADIPALARIHVEGWKAAYGGIVEQSFLDNLNEQQRAADWAKWFAEGNMKVLLACDGQGSPCGFSSFGKIRTPLPGSSPIRPLYSGEIYALYVLASHWRQGVGAALMQASAAGLRQIKHKSMCLWVLEDNERAVNFYKKHGGERCGKKMIEIGQSKVKEICFGWRDTNVHFPD